MEVGKKSLRGVRDFLKLRLRFIESLQLTAVISKVTWNFSFKEMLAKRA